MAGKFAERARRHHTMVHELLAEGHAIRTIARHLGWGRHSVQRYARAKTWQQLVGGRWQAPRASSWTRSSPICTSAPTKAAATPPSCSGRSARSATPAAPPPTVREVTGWLTRHPDSLTEDEEPQLKALLERCPELRAASGQDSGSAGREDSR